MPRHRRLALIPICILLGLMLIACMCNPISIVTKLIASPTPTNTVTPSPTATFTATATATATATPMAPVAIDFCLSDDACPGSVSFRDLLVSDLEPDLENYITFPYNTPIRFDQLWYAIDQEHLDENLAHMDFYFKIDGVRYDVPSDFEYGDYYKEGDSYSYPAYFFGVVTDGWQIYDNHMVEFGYTIDSDIDSGWGTIHPGTVNYVVNIMPVDLATATPWPTATRTYAPIIYTPKPTVAPTSACESTSTIHILNSTGGSVTIYLTGPSSYQFTLDTGDNYLTVCDGSYSFTGYGCGGSNLDGEIHSGDDQEFYCVTY